MVSPESVWVALTHIVTLVWSSYQILSYDRTRHNVKTNPTIQIVDAISKKADRAPNATCDTNAVDERYNL